MLIGNHLEEVVLGYDAYQRGGRVLAYDALISMGRRTYDAYQRGGGGFDV